MPRQTLCWRMLPKDRTPIDRLAPARPRPPPDGPGPLLRACGARPTPKAPWTVAAGTLRLSPRGFCKSTSANFRPVPSTDIALFDVFIACAHPPPPAPNCRNSPSRAGRLGSSGKPAAQR